MSRAQGKALRILTFADRTEAEMRRKLEEGGFPPQVVSDVVEWLKELHYLDDARFAAQFALSRADRKSQSVIRMELRQKGIDGDLIDSACAQVADQEAEAAYRAASGYARSREDLSMEKMMASVMRKGFPYAAARQACQRVVEELAGGDPPESL